MKKILIFTTLVAIGCRTGRHDDHFERYEARQPGEGRRERHERYSKVVHAGDESAEAKSGISNLPRRAPRQATAWCCRAPTAQHSQR
jgi:hypothetical protein